MEGWTREAHVHFVQRLFCNFRAEIFLGLSILIGVEKCARFLAEILLVPPSKIEILDTTLLSDSQLFKYEFSFSRNEFRLKMRKKQLKLQIIIISWTRIKKFQTIFHVVHFTHFRPDDSKLISNSIEFHSKFKFCFEYLIIESSSFEFCFELWKV